MMNEQTVYKVVEVTTVTDEALEEVLNSFSSMGWTLDTIQFAMRESSKRPAMAFVIFTRRGGPCERLEER